jgi:LPS-assembly protein
MLRRVAKFLLFFVAVFFIKNSWALQFSKKTEQESIPAILKADQINGDKNTNVLTADGNVEVTKGNSIVYADQMVYEKNGKIIRAIGNVKIKNIEVGNVSATKADIKDDFSSGMFFDTKMVFTDGSYLTSPQITRETPLITILKSPIYSICPNPEIGADNDLAGKKRDLFSIKSTQTTVDRNEGMMKSKGGIIRLYNVPFFYTPYISIALPSKKRKSGFLNPSYAKSTNLGLGIKIPYYFDIAPNMDLTTTPLIGVANNQILIANEFRHRPSYGEYGANLEVANNKIKSSTNSTVVVRTQAQYRWNLNGKGKFDFTENSGLDFTGNIVSDRNYLRDYHFSYLNYTLSKVNLDYINGRSYHAVKVIKIQELESTTTKKFAPLILPQIDSYIETKPLSFKEKFALTSNATSITRQDGMKYNRATFAPEFNVPLNAGGNLFNFNSKIQNDFYSLQNDSGSANKSNIKYDSFAANYRPEASLSWRLPLIKKSESNTLMIEPIASIVISSYLKNFDSIPNEDSNNAELTVSNLFVSDRIAGFDRNEAGKRANYGVKTSLFNKYGEFGLTVGQSFRQSSRAQDITIQGFGAGNKSNIVGQALYKAKKYFSMTYSFQLDQSSYSNDVNQFSTALVFDRIQFHSDYLLVRRTQQNLSEKNQLSFSSKVKLTNNLSATIATSKDFAIGRTLSRSLILTREGCCTVFGFSVVETNPSSLSKPQRSFNISLLFKNL